jgi:acetyl/propionyl-CoA carboxylase alpha subunit
MSSIKRLLIANRGEIACRIIRTCKRLGIESVAVFSDADRHAQHVRQADVACYIGTSSASESYLNATAIIAAAVKVKADAIHPGYGFLSESTQLIARCQEHGIRFVGPSLESIAAMGSKIEAKAIAQALQIPTVPGYNGGDQSAQALAAQAERIGYPVLIKASAGGGGKGMRIVHSATEFGSALSMACQEARNAFGDDRVLLEKYVQRPRHIEVQLLGDTHGNLVHLFDRECSIQRNYQKVIEEAPVSHLPIRVREQLFDCAVRLGAHLGYQGAGTVEFIVDADSGNAYFLEMNTRLQVEHPTTEQVTGLDLVEWQIRIAQGEALNFQQDDVYCAGHAIEARVNAEDPANQYLPEIGSITLYREPAAEGVRIDSGVAQGSEVTPFYDSMLAKVIAFGETRGLAVQRLLHGLNNFAIGGVKTNQEFLTSLLTRPAFHQELTTDYIQREFPHGWQPWGELMHRAIAAAALVEARQVGGSIAAATTSWVRMGAWRLTEPAGVPAKAELWLDTPAGFCAIQVSGRQGHYDVSVQDADQDTATHFVLVLTRPGVDISHDYWQVEIDGTRRSLAICIQDNHVALSSPRLRRSYHLLGIQNRFLGESIAANAGNTIVAVMPGLITDVLVSAGDRVEQGQVAVVMEAMKLIHNMICPMAGIVKQVCCQAGDNVANGALLIEISDANTAQAL